MALYITKAPVPFINKVPQRTAEQDTAEAERNRNWDPNGPLGGKGVPRPAAAAAGTVAEAASAPAARAAGGASRCRAGQGAGQGPGGRPGRQQRRCGRGAGPPPPSMHSSTSCRPGPTRAAKTPSSSAPRLALMGQSARITEREQVGRTVYRVRLGPFPTREEADTLLGQLQEQRVDAQIVRVERP